ncbi:MAG: hypothetical protein N3F07_01225 [Candidatus Micrarchaeota archaeon]|nr:hypothetical protein [Candidatus Micrarchaeota archaeon]
MDETDASVVLLGYSKFSPKVRPEGLLGGNIDRREGEIVLSGRREDDLGGAVRRRLISDINRHFFEHPKDADDTRLVFEAVEKEAVYEEDGKGNATLTIRISVELASHKPGCCCC